MEYNYLLLINTKHKQIKQPISVVDLNEYFKLSKGGKFGAPNVKAVHS